MKRFSINTIALGNLRQHKKQYISLTAAIILAMFFSASFLLFWSSMEVSIKEIHNIRYGAQDAIFFNCEQDAVDELAERGYILQNYGKAAILDYFPVDSDVVLDINASTGFSAAVCDDTALDLINWQILEGRMPEKKGEIAIEQSALARFRMNIEVGDTLTATVYTPNKMYTGSEGNTIEDGFLDEKPEKTYTLVGILSDHLSYFDDGSVIPAYRDYPAAVLSEQEQIDIGGKPIVNYYVNYTNNYWLQHKLHSESDDQLNPDFQIHDVIQGWAHNTYSDYEIVGNGIPEMIEFVSLIKIIVVVLILASCLGIINAFSANLRGKQEQIALLRAVGATKQQIRQIFRRETILIAGISIIPAIILSCAVVWGIIQVMGYPYQFVLNIWALLGTAVIGLLCIFAASFFPLWKASHIPPMQAIRNVTLSRKMHSRHIHTKLRFHVPKHLARRTLTLYRGSQLGIIALMAAEIFIMSGLLYTGSMAIPTNITYPYDYELVDESSLTRGIGAFIGLRETDGTRTGITERDIQDIRNLQSVESADGEKDVGINVIPSRGITDYLTEFGLNDNIAYLQADLPLTDPEGNELSRNLYQEYLKVKQKYGYTQDYYISSIQAHDEQVLQKLSSMLSEGEINLDKLASGEEVLIYAPSYSGARDNPYTKDPNSYIVSNYTKEEEQTARQECGEYFLQNDMFHVGDTITLSRLYAQTGTSSGELPDDAVRFDREVTIGGIVEGDSFGGAYETEFEGTKGCVITSNAGLEALGWHTGYRSVRVHLSQSSSREIERYLDDSLQAIAARNSNIKVYNFRSEARNMRNIMYGSFIAGASIIILLFAASASMVSNSFSARIQAGKRAIGTLRAVGASEQDIWKNYLFQLVYLFICGTVIGIVFEFVVLSIWQWYRCKVIYNMFFERFPPVWQPLAFMIVLFLLCCEVTRAKLKNILKSSIVENIREL